jgi:hypothetical protein
MRRKKMKGKCKVIIKNQLDKLKLSVSKGTKDKKPTVIMPKKDKHFNLFSSLPDDYLIVKMQGKAIGDYRIKVSDYIIAEALKSHSKGITKSVPGLLSWVIRLKSGIPLDPPEQSVTIGEDEPPKRPGKPPHK